MIGTEWKQEYDGKWIDGVGYRDGDGKWKWMLIIKDYYQSNTYYVCTYMYTINIKRHKL